MNRADVEMLNNSLQTVGNDALRRKQIQQQHEAEMSRMALESQMRDIQEQRYSAQAAHYQEMEDQQNKPKVQATITHPDTGTTMDFIGTPEQLDAMQQKDPSLKVSGKKEFSAKFDVGGSSFLFSDPDAADNFAKDMKEKNGIDVYATPKPNVSTLPTGQPVITDRKGGVKLGELPTGSTTMSVHQVRNPAGGTNAPISLTNTVTKVPTGYPAPPAAAAPPQTNTVSVLHPDGKTTGKIPAANLPAALAQGYTQIQ